MNKSTEKHKIKETKRIKVSIFMAKDEKKKGSPW